MGPLTGTVSFYEQGLPIAGCTNVGLTAHFAFCTITFANPGFFKVTATYSGDPKYPDASDSTVQAVNKGTTDLDLNSSAPVKVGAKVTYVATVHATWGIGPLTGTVTFSEDGSVLPTCQNLVLNGGSATCTVEFGAPGTFAISADYAGDPNFRGSTDSVSQLVGTGTLSITTTRLDDATAGEDHYSQTLAGTGGSTPYHWSITTGTLPDGLTLDATTGVISGKVSAAATTQTFTVKLSDASGATATRSFTIAVNERPHFTCGDSAEGSGGHFFHFQVTAGGTPDPRFGESGPLPAGLTFDPATGVLSGTPSSATRGTYDITFTAANSAGTASLPFSLKF